MNIISSKRFIVIIALVLAVVMAATMTLTVTNVSYAENETILDESSLVIGHVSDIHYFPLAQCYRGVDDPGYENSDFFYSLTGDTKLVLESGMVLGKLVKSIIADAKAGKAPHYFVASGDLSKNGERLALIDVANSLRYLQNEVRKVAGYDDFQVFALTGNHDLYNSDGAVYSHEDGSSHLTDCVNALQFALIFAGLGYPDANLTGADGAINLTDYMPAEYWYSSFTSGYQASSNSTQIALHYYSPVLQDVASTADAGERLNKYLALGDDNNVLSFAAEVLTPANKGYSFLAIDASDRTIEDVGTAVALSEKEYLNLASSDTTHILYVTNAQGYLDTTRKLNKKSNASEIEAAYASGKMVYRATGYDHLTGGRITEGCLDWMQAFCATQTGDKTTLGEETIISVFHQNALPHWEQEDEILKDFTLYNWENTSKRLLGMGVRYALTGHMHASDAMAYTDAEGRTLYDFETGSIISYASPRRYIEIARKNLGGKLGEKTSSSVIVMENIKEEPSDDVFNPAVVWDQAAFDAATTLSAKLASNPAFEMYVRRYDMLSVQTLNDYITIDIYSRLLDRVLNHFVSDKMIDNLKGSIEGLLVGENSKLIIGSIDLSDLGETLWHTADYIIDTVLYDLYPDGKYPYKGETYDSAIEYIKAIIYDFVDKKFGDDSIASTVNPANSGKLSLKDIVTFIPTAHAEGTEVKLCLTDAELQAELAYIDAHFAETDCTGMTAADKLQAFKQPTDRTFRKRMTAALKDIHEYAASGALVEDLLNTLLDPLYRNDDSLLKTLLNYKFDFNDAVEKGYLTEEQFDQLSGLFDMVNGLVPALPQLVNGLMGTDIPEDAFDIYEEIELLKENNVILGVVVDELMPILKAVAASLIGFNLTGDTLTEAVDTALHGYLTESFYVGLGGILDEILVAFATDVYADLDEKEADETVYEWLAEPYLVQPYAGFSYAGQQITYANPKTSSLVSWVGAPFNEATQQNGRVPSHLTAAFDVDNPTTGYVVKFYTAEDVYASFGFREAGCECIYNTVSTSRATADMSLPYIDSTATQTFDGVTVTITTQTKPQYIPLIDLGLAALTHAQIEDDDDVPYVWGDRDAASANSVIYWNVTTVKVSGLDPSKEYEYDVEGIYHTSTGEDLRFSLATYVADPNGPVYSLKMKTAKPDTETSFEFLTIADIQGMIQGMYTDSYKAVEALLADERTKNFDFILNAGDMADSGKNFNQWGYALDTYEPLFANYSQFFTAGNHEGKTYAMTNFFAYATPKDEDDNELIDDVLGGVYYSFDYANAHFVVLNTNDAGLDGLGETQFNWLKKDLETSDKKWKFVLMHKSLFSGGSHSYDGEVVAMRKQLVPLFAETGVNIVFAGHDHTYTTTMLIDKNGKATDKQDLNGLQYTGDGVLYITLGTMGTKYYEYGTNPDVTPKFDDDKSILHTLDSQTFGKVVVTADSITFTSYYYDAKTNSLKVVGESDLVDHPVFDKKIAITLFVIIPTVVVAGAVTATLLILKKKGKLGKKKAE